MEIPGLAALRQARLRLSAEGDDHIYLLDEPVTGQVLILPQEAARTVMTAKEIVAGNRRATQEDASAIGTVAAYLATLTNTSQSTKKPFNPIFMSLPLFDIRPVQRHLGGLAKSVFSRQMAVFVAFLTLMTGWILISTDFVFLSHTGDLLSLQSLLTFALIAPVLKLFHETGHVLAATRFGVPVRRAGLILIALFPLPFVDCSEADFRARRGQRIVISLAGLMTDLFIAMLAFIAWHLVDDGPVRSLLSSVVVLNTVTAVLFNLNPLMKLDGYFAMSDLIHRRNLHSDGQRFLRSLRQTIGDFRLATAMNMIRRNFWLLAFVLAAVAYKVYILTVIAWTILPKYFGLGIVLLAWGAVAMFMVSSTRSKAQGGQRSKKRFLWPLLLGGGIAGILMIPMPFTHVAELRLDLTDSYQVRAISAGVAQDVRPAGPVQAGDALIRLSNLETDVRIAENQADQAIFAYLVQSKGAADPVALRSANERLQTSRALGAELENEQAGLIVAAAADGWFVPSPDMQRGAYASIGANIGALLPDVQKSNVTGSVPEVYADMLRDQLKVAELRTSDSFLTLDPATIRIREAQQQADLTKGLTFDAVIPIAPQDTMHEAMHLRMSFTAQPLWQHARFLFQRIRLNFLQLAEAEERRAYGATQ